MHQRILKSWRSAWKSIQGRTATLTITNANSADNGSYTLTVMDGTRATVSDAATITVTQNAASLDPAYNGAGANGDKSSTYTITALNLPAGRTIVGTSGQFSPGTNSNTSGVSPSLVGTQPGAAASMESSPHFSGWAMAKSSWAAA